MAFLSLLAVVIFFAPIVLSIVALVKVSKLNDELKRLRNSIVRERYLSSSSPAKSAPKPVVPPPQAQPIPKPSSPPISKPRPKPQRIVASIPSKKPKVGLEFLMGGKAAAFAGIAILVMGIVFLVGYAIQQSWLGPGARVVLGLLFGGLLVGGGHFIGQRDEKYTLFARVLTGGGSALFYFTVFAAYTFYHLIGAVAAGAGLFASALAVFGLAMVYRAQSVAVLGVLGAFTTPLLIGGNMNTGIFPLVYVAVVNVPVILLGIRRKWQLLYNLAFVFTVVLYLDWLDHTSCAPLWSGLVFAILFFAEYAALGLLKLRCEQNVLGRQADWIRLIAASALLMGAVYGLLHDAGLNQWIGTAFLLLALLHVGLASFAFKVLRRFNGEILSFLAGALLFATLALPAQLDGAWVSLGWAIEGAVLAWFALRVQSRIVQATAVLLGLIGIMKALLFDVTLYTQAPHLFLNARFMVGLLSAVLLGVQGKLAGRFPEKDDQTFWQDSLWWAGVLGVVLIFFADTFWTLGTNDAFSWMITSLVLLVAGTAVVWIAPRKSSVTLLGSVLLLLVPLKIFLIDTLFGLSCIHMSITPFANVSIWIQLAVVALLVLVLQPRLAAREVEYIFPAPLFSRMLNLLSLAAGIGVLSTEILRNHNDWANMGVTILWAVCALSLIFFGMKRRTAAHRYFGLVLFGLATLKVLVVDTSELNGLERIGALMGTGILLLVLSFGYQKASAYFHGLEEEK